MDRNKILAINLNDPDCAYQLLRIMLELNDELERLKRFAKNVNTFGEKIYPDLITLSDKP